MSVKSIVKTTYQYIKDQRSQAGEPVRFYNWIGDIKDNWFRKFIASRNIPCSHDKTIAFFSVFGDLFPIAMDKSRVKVFFTGENIHRNEFGFSFQNYSGYLQNKHFDLSLAFDYVESDSYLRFPLWILYFVDPEKTDSDSLKELCRKFSDHSGKETDSKRFCSVVSGHDPNGLRREIYDSLTEIDSISCGGRFLNNTDELKQVFKNNKCHYLEQFKFNICPENSDAPGYVTEKLMEAIFSGALPIYWGSDNNPEPKILNKDAIIFWNKGGDNTENIRLIRSLQQDPQLYRKFYAQPRLLPDADKVINQYLDELEERLRVLISTKGCR